MSVLFVFFGLFTHFAIRISSFFLFQVYQFLTMVKLIKLIFAFIPIHFVSEGFLKISEFFNLVEFARKNQGSQNHSVLYLQL